jgi:hypothetical protein
MAKDSVSDWDAAAANNTDVGGINIQGSASIANGDNALRAIMAQVAAYTRRGADLASASTLNLDSIDTLLLNITGTTTVTAVTLSSGHWRIARATGTFQITAGASLIVNGMTTVNFTTLAGDYLLFEGYGSSLVRVSLIGGALRGVLPALGGAGQQLRVNSGATALEYFSGGHVMPSAITTTSGTSHDVGSLPAGIRRIVFTFAGVSTSGTSPIMIQLGDSGGLETSGYTGSAGFMSESPAVNILALTSGFLTTSATLASANNNGVITLERHAGNLWGAHGTISRIDVDIMNFSSGYKVLSGELDRFRITTFGGTDTFDLGEIYYSYQY